MKKLMLLMILWAGSASAQIIPDSEAMFECYFKHAKSSFVESRETCRALLETPTKDKGTLALRNEVLLALDAGYSPVNDIILESRPVVNSGQLRYVRGRVELARDLGAIAFGETLYFTFDGFLSTQSGSPRFTLSKPKRVPPLK